MPFRFAIQVSQGVSRQGFQAFQVNGRRGQIIFLRMAEREQNRLLAILRYILVRGNIALAGR
jgi:hypothetical protein